VENQAFHQANRSEIMRDLVLPDFVVYISMAFALIAVIGTILSGPITDWMIAREDRKKAAQAAAEAEAVESAAPKPA